MARTDSPGTTLIVSDFAEANIFHFFAREIKAVWEIVRHHDRRSFRVLLLKCDGNGANRWRLGVLRAIVPTVYRDCQEVREQVERVIRLQPDAWMVDPSTFVEYQPSPVFTALADVVKEHYGAAGIQGTEVVFVVRRNSRILYDHVTRSPLERSIAQILQRSGIPFREVCFDDAGFEEQAHAMARAKVMLSCHGAANTNLFLLPPNGHLMEINFRRFWNCDPVCPAHRSGRLAYRERCDGPLTVRPSFHKADYHNLSGLFGKKYTELGIEDAEGFVDGNPINVMKVFVDAEQVARAVIEAFEN